MSKLKTLNQLDAHGKTVLVRVDFNVPLDKGVITDDTRITRALPTIRCLVEQGAKVVLVSHLGRPKGCGFEEEFSLKPVACALSEKLGCDVRLSSEVTGPATLGLVQSLECGQVALLENVRFDSREKKNDATFASELASIADIYVNDAFGAAHRAHASTSGVANILPSYAGLLMQEEVETLQSILDSPKRPFVAILGGSKVSDKIKVIDSLIEKADVIVIGGAMCFTFLTAQGLSVGKSLVENDWASRADEMYKKAQERGVKFLLPVDVVVAEEISENADTSVVPVEDIPDDMMGLDIGPKTEEMYSKAILEAGSVFWNGPMGVFECSAFESGTKAIANAAAKTSGDVIVGGGDSVAAIKKFDVADKMTFVSTGGGASMEFIQGDVLAGVEPLYE